jgi:hypothetical protein
MQPQEWEENPETGLCVCVSIYGAMVAVVNGVEKNNLHLMSHVR